MWCSFLTFFFIFRTGHSKNVSINFHINCLNARIGICAPLSGCVCEYLCLSVGFSVGVCIYNCTFQTLKSICTYQQRNCLLNADCVPVLPIFFRFSILFFSLFQPNVRNEKSAKSCTQAQLGCSSVSLIFHQATHFYGPRLCIYVIYKFHLLCL